MVGNASGLAVQLIAAGLGVGAIVARSDSVFTAVKLVGAGYLVPLGLRNIRDRRALGAVVSSRAEPKRMRKRMRRIVREGFVARASNPRLARPRPSPPRAARHRRRPHLIGLGAALAVTARRP